ncbi:MAG: hypothetical protein HKN47_29465 [Pirellulaceae bacterium]|nr:hypothetical protein [Pirellulaceae bacterium]
MNSRIFSWSTVAVILVIAGTVVDSQSVCAQDNPGYFTDPDSGIVYRKVIRSIERPVVETKIERKEQTVFRPETVTETFPESKTVFMPQTEYTWQPVLHGRWNPFRQPTVTYHHLPRTQWKQQSDVVTRTQTRTKWVPEKRLVDVPQRIVRIEREDKVDFEPVGRVAAPQQATPPSNVSEAIASRLRPLASNARVQSLYDPGANPWRTRAGGMGAPAYDSSPRSYGASSWTVRGQQIASANGFNAGGPRIAAQSIGRMTSDPPQRSMGQSGIRSTDLYPGPSRGYSQALPPASGGTGIANLPGWSLWR